MQYKIYLIYLVSILLACSPTYIIESNESKLIPVAEKIDSSILNIILPYQEGIESQMSEVLSYSVNSLEKGRPQSTIGNFVTDLCLNYTDADICIMNNGGLRTTIDKGNITMGKIYELMPFENELVVLELDKSDYISLLKYIVKRGGEPFSGMSIKINKENKIISNSRPVNFENGEKINVITSDYLANGGDNMSFFKNKEQKKVGIKLRDAIIDHCKKTDTINVKLDDRIIILKNE